MSDDERSGIIVVGFLIVGLFSTLFMTIGIWVGEREPHKTLGPIVGYHQIDAADPRFDCWEAPFKSPEHGSFYCIPKDPDHGE